jgi:hypothetical protein
MAQLYSSEYNSAYIAEPSSKIEVQKQHGRVRRAYASITLAAELAVADLVDFMKLPKGARIVDARVKAVNDGTSGILDIGWPTNGSDAADQDGIFVGATSVDFGAGAIDSKMVATVAAYNKKLAEETIIQGYCTEVSVASTGNAIELEVYYILD